MPKGSEKFEKIIDLYEQVEKAMNQLMVLGAENCLLDEFELVYAMIQKLPSDCQEEWDKYSHYASPTVPIWTKFWVWMGDNYARATSA